MGTQIGMMLSRSESLRPSVIFASSSVSPLDRVVASRLRMFLRITMRSGESKERSWGATVVDKGDVGTKVPNDPIDLVSEDMNAELTTL